MGNEASKDREVFCNKCCHLQSRVRDESASTGPRAWEDEDGGRCHSCLHPKNVVMERSVSWLEVRTYLAKCHEKPSRLNNDNRCTWYEKESF